MRYCPTCKREVGSKMTVGQVLLALILLTIMILPGLIYIIGHTKKCPVCGAPTRAHK